MVEPDSKLTRLLLMSTAQTNYLQLEQHSSSIMLQILVYHNAFNLHC